MREYNGEPKRQPILLDDDGPDPSDLNAARLAREDAEYQAKHDAVNRAANVLARAVWNLADQEADFFMDYPELAPPLDVYRQAMRGIVSGSTGEG